MHKSFSRLGNIYGRISAVLTVSGSRVKEGACESAACKRKMNVDRNRY